LNLNGHVRFVGFQQDIPSFLQALDVFGFGSRSEGFGQVVIETMAAGKPVVATQAPPFPEIVADGVTGILVEPDNPSAFAHALLTLLRHPVAARQMGRAGQLRVDAHFTAARMADDVLQTYRRVLQGS
ncbi:MAG: glycosyltransferase family 4 protein, partial [Armatimonadota bacterium]